MQQEDKLIDEVVFWYTYIQDWQINHGEPVPERALALLDNSLLKLKNCNLEKHRAKYLPGAKRLAH